MKVADELILDLIRQHRIKDQAELVVLLNNNGIEITQASLSRRLKKLSINKHQGFYQTNEPANKISFSITDSIKKIVKAPPNIIVIHTIPGHASSLAYYIDQKMCAAETYRATTKLRHDNQKNNSSSTTSEIIDQSGIAGTIAGDDTVMVIITDVTKLEALVERFKTKL